MRAGARRELEPSSQGRGARQQRSSRLPGSAAWGFDVLWPGTAAQSPAQSPAGVPTWETALNTSGCVLSFDPGQHVGAEALSLRRPIRVLAPDELGDERDCRKSCRKKVVV